MSAEQWAGMDLPAMWWAAQCADTEMAWQHVVAWQQTAELYFEHERHLRACRDELVAAWPPERSPAARAFVNYLDDMLVALAQAQEDASGNRHALSALLGSLASAKEDMTALKAKWDEYEAEDRARSQNLSNTLPHSAGTTWRQQLNEQARARMTRSDNEVAKATEVMRVPTDFQPRVDSSARVDVLSHGAGAGPDGGGSSDGWMVPPVIASPPNPSVGSAGGLGQPGGLGPGLAGGPVGGGSGPGGPGPGGGGPPGALPPGGWPGGVLPVPGWPGQAGRSAVMGAPGGLGGRLPRVGSPLGIGEPGHGGPPRRVNPVGGVIGASEPAAGRAAGHGAPLMAGGGAGRGEERRGREPEPYQEWPVRQGVPAVIEPGPEPRHEAGPGVIGIDR